MRRPLPSSHWATEALRLPVTGSSAAQAVDRRPGAQLDRRLASRAGGSRRRRGRSRAAPGRSSSTRSALSSRAAIQPGPLSTHSTASISPGSTSERAGDFRAASSSEAGPERTSGGAAKASPCARSLAADPHQPGLALLDDLARAARLSPGLEPGVAGAERRMAGERQLEHRGEDADPVVGLGPRRRQHEGRLGEVGPAREPLHLLVVSPSASSTTATGLPEQGPLPKTSTWAKRRLTGGSVSTFTLLPAPPVRDVWLIARRELRGWVQTRRRGSGASPVRRDRQCPM